MAAAFAPSGIDVGIAVRLRGVSKIYDNGVAALGPIDLDVGRGEFVSLLGPSGCGKSTALRLIAGLSAASSGVVEVSGHERRKSIGFVFQEPTLMRVSLARALVTDPDILLMDEPFAALDEITRFRLNDDLLTVWRNLRKTVIFVTHSVFESVYLSQRVLVMTLRPGRVAAEFRIDAAEPRSEQFRTSSEYAGQCRNVSIALARASGEKLAS
jgi:NitT/TauT family transport system ATP-binding protein